MSYITDEICSILGGDPSIPEDQYQVWKDRYESQTEAEKVFDLLGAISQYLLSPSSHASCSVLAMALVCTHRWTNEKMDEEF